jgi:hypothetical protein
MVSRIVGILKHISAVGYQLVPSIGVRLEDIKNKPLETLDRMCGLMGADYTSSLSKMSAGGLRWWGDPASPNYDVEGMDPFGKKAINRKLGSVFSDNDLLFFETLLHPFKVHFDYDLEYTKRKLMDCDLELVEGRMFDLLDFEKEIAKKLNISEGEFKMTGHFAFLRHIFKYRIHQLIKDRTYSNMIDRM